MAGVKGRSGGARPGAGRKPNPPAPREEPILHAGDDALALLHDIAFGRLDATSLQLRAAIAAVQYTHVKKHDGGIKDERQSKAEQAAEGLRPAQPPRLVSNG